MSSVRAFIALPLPQEITLQLGHFITQMKSQVPHGLRWVKAGNIHLTLLFLGDTSLVTINQLAELLSPRISALHAPQVEFTRLGAFPNPDRMRVFWLGMNTPQELLDLQQAVAWCCQQCKVPTDGKKFTPHLTLARVSDHITAVENRQASEMLKQSLPFTKSTLLLDQLIIYKSELKPSGAEYTPLYRFGLEKPMEVKPENA